MNDYAIESLDSIPSDVEETLLQGIIEEAAQHKRHLIQSFAVVLKNSEGQIVGGACGASLYGCIYVDLLWVHRSARGQGFGTKLMLEVERVAQERGCSFATVNTMDWEAMPFYQKLGYSIEFVREGFEGGSRMFLMGKALTSGAENARLSKTN